VDKEMNSESNEKTCFICISWKVNQAMDIPTLYDMTIEKSKQIPYLCPLHLFKFKRYWEQKNIVKTEN
jgi:hypothetical protein